MVNACLDATSYRTWLIKEHLMLEILFVLGFFFMLMLTGISLLGMVAALVVAFALMMLGGFLAIVVKMLPWLLLAVLAVWIYRTFFRPDEPKYRRRRLP
jgi:phage shock protein G